VSNIDISGVLKVNVDPLLPMPYNYLIDKPVVLQASPGIAADAPGYLPPNSLSSALENDYQYVRNNEPDEGYAFFRHSGDEGVLFMNVLLPAMISLNVPKSFITKYHITSGVPPQAHKV